MKATEQFKREYLPLQPAMQRVAERLLGNEDEAADAVQDCFVKLWNDREQLRRVVNREAWCVQLVKNRCLDLLRRRRPTVSVEECDALLADSPSAADIAERYRAAVDLMQRLPERQREAVRMRHFDDLPTADIARRLDTSEGNVYVLLSRAYNSLKQMLMKYEEQ